MTRHEIQILRAVKMAQRTIAVKTGVSVRSVRRIEREPTVMTSDPAALIAAKRIGRPSIAAPWTEQVEGWLQEDRELPGVEIVRRLREEQGYRGGKSAVYELVRRLRPTTAAPLVRFEGVPGEFSQHDFGQVDVRYTDGRRSERVHFFASRLKWSRFMHVVLVPDEREETLIRALLAALDAFEGVPLVTVWDNPKTVVLKRKRELIVWNPVFGQVALDYRFPALLLPPRRSESRDPSQHWGSRVAPCSVSTCHAHYPGERSGRHRSLRRDPAAFPVQMAGRRSQRPCRGLLGLHSRCGPSTRRPTRGGPLFRELQRFGCPPRRLGSYRDVPTISLTGLSPVRDTAPLRGAHSNPCFSLERAIASPLVART